MPQRARPFWHPLARRDRDALRASPLDWPSRVMLGCSGLQPRVAAAALVRPAARHLNLEVQVPTQLTLPEPATDGSVMLPLYYRGEVVAYTRIDADRLVWASQWRWRLNSAGYASRNVKVAGVVQTIRLAREILGLPRTYDGRQADHLSRVRLDDRRCNLRVTTPQENGQNLAPRGPDSGYRGVRWDRQRGKWRAVARCNGRPLHLGRYANEREAAVVVARWRAANMPGTVEDPDLLAG